MSSVMYARLALSQHQPVPPKIDMKGCCVPAAAVRTPGRTTHTISITQKLSLACATLPNQTQVLPLCTSRPLSSIAYCCPWWQQLSVFYGHGPHCQTSPELKLMRPSPLMRWSNRIPALLLQQATCIPYIESARNGQPQSKAEYVCASSARTSCAVLRCRGDAQPLK